MKNDETFGDAIISATKSVTKKYAKQRRKEEREASAYLYRDAVMVQSYHVSLKSAAWDIMEEAYLKVSADGTLPALARQIMYAARPYIQSNADVAITSKFGRYFTGTLLPDYLNEHPSETSDWNVAFDARGHFKEPHTKEVIALGTLEVRDHLSRVEEHEVDNVDFNIWEKRYPTIGPDHRYGAILFVEKEGFMPLFDAVKLKERYDLAMMSTKGMSVTASRELVDTPTLMRSVSLT